MVAALFERHGGRVLAFCRARLRDAAEAEDAQQTTFLLAHRALERGVVPQSEATWLLTIAQNVCLNRARDVRRVRGWEHSREPEELERVAGPAEPRRLDVEELKEAVAALPEQQRRAILLREWQGCSYAEIERELELGKAAVETLIFRARRSLAQQLQGRLRALDGLSIASALKGWLGGGGAAAAKLGAAAAVVAVAGTGVAHRLQSHPPVSRDPQPAPPVQVDRPVAAPKPIGTARAAAAAPAPKRPVAPVVATAAASVGAAPMASGPTAGPAAAPAGAPAPAPVTPAPSPSPAAPVPSPPVPKPPVTPIAAQPLPDLVEPTVATATAAVEEVVTSVSQTGEAAVDDVLTTVNETVTVIGSATAAGEVTKPILPARG